MNTTAPLGSVELVDVGLGVVRAYVISEHVGHATPRSTLKDYVHTPAVDDFSAEALVYDIFVRPSLAQFKKKWVDEEYLDHLRSLLVRGML